MKKFLLFIVLIGCLQTTHAQIPSSCTIPLTLKTNYDADVKHLALKRIFDVSSPYRDSIIIPQVYQDTIWQGLSAIFNLTAVSARDSVFDNYCIHHEPSNPVYHSIYVSVDTSYAWTKPWQNLSTITGNTPIDNLLSAYGFTITGYWGFIKTAILSTTQTINVKPLCDSLETFLGVAYSEPKSTVVDGNKIAYNKTGNVQLYDFTVGYGDCPSGCIGSHIFKFKVYNNCSVDYLGIVDIIDHSSSIPAPTNCNITANVKNEKENAKFKVSPNPFLDNTTFVIQSDKPNESYSFELTDVLGKQVRFIKEINTREFEFSRNGLPNGIYFYKIYSTESIVGIGKLVIK
jgi:hypothetical protein